MNKHLKAIADAINAAEDAGHDVQLEYSYLIVGDIGTVDWNAGSVRWTTTEHKEIAR